MSEANPKENTNKTPEDGNIIAVKPLLGDAPVDSAITLTAKHPRANPPREIGGPAGPEPTRYGDWEKNGRCSDF